MIRGLKVTMIVWAAFAILLGLGLVFTPEQLGAMQGYAKGPAYVPFFLALLGVTFIALGAFIIIAARDPLKHILWVQFAIVLTILAVAVEASSIGRDFITFKQAGMLLIIDVVLSVALLALYPWRAARSGK